MTAPKYLTVYTSSLRNNPLVIPVHVVEQKDEFGKDKRRVVPVGGAGSSWVESFRLRDAPDVPAREDDAAQPQGDDRWPPPKRSITT